MAYFTLGKSDFLWTFFGPKNIQMYLFNMVFSPNNFHVSISEIWTHLDLSWSKKGHFKKIPFSLLLNEPLAIDVQYFQHWGGIFWDIYRAWRCDVIFNYFFSPFVFKLSHSYPYQFTTNHDQISFWASSQNFRRQTRQSWNIVYVTPSRLKQNMF